MQKKNVINTNVLLPIQLLVSWYDTCIIDLCKVKMGLDSLTSSSDDVKPRSDFFTHVDVKRLCWCWTRALGWSVDDWLSLKWRNDCYCLCWAVGYRGRSSGSLGHRYSGALPPSLPPHPTQLAYDWRRASFVFTRDFMSYVLDEILETSYLICLIFIY